MNGRDAIVRRFSPNPNLDKSKKRSKRAKGSTSNDSKNNGLAESDSFDGRYGR